MSISSSTRKAGPYSCNGATVAFPFAFKVFAAADVRVVLTDADEAESDLVLGTNYTVALNADQDANPGGTVTTTTAYVSGYLITLTSQVQNLQPVTLTNQGGFYPKVINAALDRLTILVQQVVEQVGRAVKTPISSGLTPDQLIADLYAVEANAGNSATAAANSAANAAASAAAAAAVLDNFDDRYLGQKTTDPLVGNDGNPLQVGALYYNTVDGVMRVYTGTGWIDAAMGVGSEDVSFLSSGVSAVPRTAQDKLREIVSVKDFGAKGDDTTDDTTAVQAAINAVKANGGGSVMIPKGTYKISAALVIDSSNVRIIGDGIASKIKTYSQTAHVFTVAASGGGEIDNIIFRDFSIWASVTKTAGAAFDCTKTARCEWSRVFIGTPEDLVTTGQNRLYNGIALNQFDYCVVSACHIITSNEGVACNGDASSLFGAGLWFNNGTKIQSQSTGAAVHIGGGAGGVYFGDVDIIDNLYNVRISTARQPGVQNREVFFGATCSLDSAKQQGVLVEPNSITHLDFTGTWLASAGLQNSLCHGLEIQGPNPNLVLKCSSVRFFNNQGGGLVANAGDLTLNGCVFYSNGSGTSVTTGNGYGNGLWVPNTAVSALRVSGCKFDNNGRSAASAGYGMKIVNGVGIFNIAHNTFYSNVQGAISYPGVLDSNRMIRDNLGYVTRARGDATITTGNGSVTVNHGLATDRAVRVNVSGLGSIPEALFYSTVPNSTSFDIRLGITATRNNDFQWEAYSI